MMRKRKRERCLSMTAMLKNEYIHVVKGSVLSYGGNQLWAYSAAIRRCGCGPVAALDTALYLLRAHGGKGRLLSALPGEGPIPLAVYNELLGRLCKSHFPLIPPFGINPAVLALGMNRLFSSERIPFTAHVIPATDKTREKIQTCLQADSPALLVIGQNFPFVWQKNRLTFYRRRPDETYAAASGAKAHFVAVTGMEEDWLRISSWGIEYYVNYIEYVRYVREYSARVISGLIYCEKKEKQL